MELGVASDGRITGAGAGHIQGSVNFALARYRADGSLDPSYGDGGKVVTDFGGWEEINDMILRPDGSVFVAGGSTEAAVFTDDRTFDFAVARYDRNGRLDRTFGNGGRVVTDFKGWEDVAYGPAIAPDRKLVAAGHS